MNSIFNKNRVVTFDSLVNDFFNIVDNIDNVYNAIIKSNVKELSDRYQLELVVAGYKKEDIKIDINNGVLTITSEIKNEKDVKDSYVRYEYGKQPFNKQYRIPEDVDVNKIKASQNDGILTVELFKYEDKQSGKKTITID